MSGILTERTENRPLCRNEHLYEGRYSPRIGGKRISRNVYAKTREECEEKLAELIKEMKSELKICSEKN